MDFAFFSDAELAFAFDPCGDPAFSDGLLWKQFAFAWEMFIDDFSRESAWPVLHVDNQRNAVFKNQSGGLVPENKATGLYFPAIA